MLIIHEFPLQMCITWSHHNNRRGTTTEHEPISGDESSLPNIDQHDDDLEKMTNFTGVVQKICLVRVPEIPSKPVMHVLDRISHPSHDNRGYVAKCYSTNRWCSVHQLDICQTCHDHLPGELFGPSLKLRLEIRRNCAWTHQIQNTFDVEFVAMTIGTCFHP